MVGKGITSTSRQRLSCCFLVPTGTAPFAGHVKTMCKGLLRHLLRNRPEFDKRAYFLAVAGINGHKPSQGWAIDANSSTAGLPVASKNARGNVSISMALPGFALKLVSI